MVNTLKFYQDFPKKGIKFIDIIPFLQDKAVFNQIIDRLVEFTTTPNVAAPEARGFLFASPLLVKSPTVTNVIPMRKSGKLPFNEGDLVEVRIEKEYGFDQLYYRKSDIGGRNTHGRHLRDHAAGRRAGYGGTAEGIARSFEGMRIEVGGKSYGVKIKEFIFLVHLSDLDGKERLEKIAPVHTLMSI